MSVALAVDYITLVVLNFVVLALVAHALLNAPDGRTAGRLLATLCAFTGLEFGAAGRLVNDLTLVLLGVTLINLGLVLYILYVPANGPLQAWARWRQRKGRGGGR